MRAWIWLSTICLAVPLITAGCGGRSALRTAPPARPECELFEPTREAADSITVALLDEVELEIAPWARNPSERLLFHHLYETLTTVDCLGDVRTGLAVSWKRFDSGRHWVFRLRGEAEFWDGTPVTARDVVTSWRELAIEPQTISAVVDSVAADDDHMLHVYLSRPREDILRVVSELEFAVVKSSDVSPWPLGSGPYRILSAERRSSEKPQRTITVDPADGSYRPVIFFVETTRRDARDLLEGTADVMVTADPSVLSYAARHPQLETAALPWTRTYLLLSTSRVDALRAGRTLPAVAPALVAGLARDAVRGDARGYHPAGWWDESLQCGDALAGSGGPGTSIRPGMDAGRPMRQRILFDRDDPTARELAERIVALAAAGPGASPEAGAVFAALPGLRTNGAPDLATAGLSPGELASSLRSGDEFAYVISIARRTLDPCNELIKLANRVPWLTAVGDDFARAMIPLADTRQHVIVSGDNIGLSTDWLGDILITPGSRTRGARRGDDG